MAKITENRRSHPVDVHVGRRVRVRRREIRLSQWTLAAHLDVTYQQLQKYETGANRISASTLYDIAQALRVPVAYFYDGLSDDADRADWGRNIARADAVAATPGGGELLDAYLILPSRLKRSLVHLVCGMAGDDDRTLSNRMDQTVSSPN